MILGRRQFLQQGGIGVAGLTATTGIATAADVTIRGQVVDYTGAPVARRRIAVDEQRRDGIFRYVVTDADGVFSTDVNPKQTYSLGLYKSANRKLHAPELNGVPHIEGLGEHYVGSNDTDLGTLEVPRGYEVDVLVLDRDGTPVEDADVDFRDGSGFGAHARILTTNSDGYLVIEDASFTGFEAAGLTTVSVSLASDDSESTEYSDRFQITEPVTIRVQEGAGMSMEAGATGDADPIETATATPTTTSTPQSTSQTRTATSAGQTDAATATATSGAAQRGFLRNGENADDLGGLADPLVLTVGGFALSVAGIVHQLVRG